MMSLHIAIINNAVCKGRGGAEHMAISLANDMTRRGHRVTLFCDKTGGREPAFPLDPRVSLRMINPSDAHANIASLRASLAASGLDVCAVLETGVLHLFWAVVLLGTGIPYVYSEHTSPPLVEELWSRAGRLAAMSGADAIHLLLDEYAFSLPPFLRERVTVIPNAAPHARNPEATAPDEQREPVITSLGRLDPIKQIELLVEAFTSLASEFPEWRLEIWGNARHRHGRYFRALQVAARKCPAIRMMGATDEPLAAMRRGRIFCIPSKHEGFPLTILEAMSSGMPVVGFAGCPGVGSIIQHEVNGLLAPSMTAASLAEALARLMRDSALRKKLAEGGRESLAKYQPGPVFDAWERLLVETAACKGHTRLDAFAEEPFASTARLSAAARREYLFRDFGAPFPGTPRWAARKALGALQQGKKRLLSAVRAFRAFK